MNDAAGSTVQDAAAPVSVLAVIVVYKCLAADSPSLLSLLEAARTASPAMLRLKVLVFDNTPDRTESGALPEGVLYRAMPDNPGLAKPYNEALFFAEENGFSWLLTLDQDTHLPADFLALLAPYAERFQASNQVAAIVPVIADHGRVISPFRYVGGFFPVVLAAGTQGISKRYTSALNSASLLRVRMLRELGGYDLRFPLHNSDTRLYQRLDEAGKRVFVAGNILVGHELAILKREDRMKPDRYRKLLEDECEFWDRHMGVLGRTERLLRLAGRVCKGYLEGENATFRNVAAKEISRRVFTSRRDRMRTGG